MINKNTYPIIRFKLWDKINKKMIYPNNSGQYLITLEGRVFRDCQLLDENDITILPFSGVCDSYGNEIYLGDCLYNEDDDETMFVTYDDGIWSCDHNTDYSLHQLKFMVDFKILDDSFNIFTDGK